MLDELLEELLVELLDELLEELPDELLDELLEELPDELSELLELLLAGELLGLLELLLFDDEAFGLLEAVVWLELLFLFEDSLWLISSLLPSTGAFSVV